MQQTGNPESDAVALIESLGLANMVPVDPIAIARQLGIAVYLGGTDRYIAGKLIKRRGQDPVILLNAQDPKSRQRFTCGHEVGHYVRRSSLGEEDWEAVDERGFLATTGRDSEERYANRFASALLMPADDVRANYSPERTVADLARRYQVSPEAMRIRLETLGLV